MDGLVSVARNDRWRGGIGGNNGNGGNGGKDSGGWDAFVFDGEFVWLATGDGSFCSVGISSI